MVAKGEGRVRERRTGSLGLADANCDTENGLTTKSYCETYPMIGHNGKGIWKEYIRINMYN